MDESNLILIELSGIPLTGMGFQGRTSHQFPTLHTFLSAFTEPKNNAPFQSSFTIFFNESNVIEKFVPIQDEFARYFENFAQSHG